MKKRVIALSAFVLLTIALVAVVLYTAFFYFGIYRATHSLNIRAEDFSVTDLNSTYSSTNVVLIVDNPSEHTFQLVYVLKRLTHDSWGDGQFIVVDTVWPTIPWQVQPSSNVTLTIDTTVSSEKIQPSKPIYMEIEAYLKGPLVGGFLITFYEVFSSW